MPLTLLLIEFYLVVPYLFILVDKIIASKLLSGLKDSQRINA